MIDHLVIFGAIANFGIGFGGLIYIVQINRKYRYPFLKPLIHYTFQFNLIVLTLLAVFYQKLNIPLDQKFLATIHRDIVYLLINTLLLGMLYSMLRIIAGFLQKSLHPKIKTVFFSVFFFISVSTLLKIVFPIHRQVFFWVNIPPFTFFMVISLVELSSLAIFSRQLRSHDDLESQRLGKSFAFFCLTRYYTFLLVYAFLRFFSLPHWLSTILILLVFSYYNIILFIWAKYVFVAAADTSFANMEDLLRSICQRYKISKRESEVLKLLIAGKKNKEMEDILFISINTIKNHVQHIYQKLNVKGRIQLLHYIQKLRDM